MIPNPKDDYQDLLIIKEDEHFTSESVKEKVEMIINDLDSIDSKTINIIEEQMKNVSDLFEKSIKAAQQLFENLMKLKDNQVNAVNEKKERTVELLSKLEITIDYIRKL